LEEKQLMNRLLDSIKHAEDLENAEWLPSHVSNVSAPCKNDQVDVPSTWENPPKRMVTSEQAPWQVKQASSDKPAARAESVAVGANASVSKVEQVETVQASFVRFKLPKWAPSRDGKKLLFTRGGFQSQVLDKVVEESELLFHVRHNRYWSAQISEHPDIYSVEARGPASAVHSLRKQAELFIRKHVSVANLMLLLDDEDSNLVDIKVDVKSSRSTLGLRFYDFDYGAVALGGVWVKSIANDGAVANSLGGAWGSINGCALVAINGQRIHKSCEVQALIQNIKVSGADNELSTLTFCLPKNADLTKAADLSKLDLKSKIGRLKAPKTDEELIRAYKTVMEDTRSPEITFVVPSAEGFGSAIKEIPGSPGGLYLHKIRKNGQIRRLLGKQASLCGAVLWKVAGNVIHSVDQLEKVLKKAEGCMVRVSLGKH
jgi:hypothetical protein